jgi:phenylalanyl-tRNA synthetase beta subunit
VAAIAATQSARCIGPRVHLSFLCSVSARANAAVSEKSMSRTNLTSMGQHCRYCARLFEVEPVEVTDSLGSKSSYPHLAPRKMDVSATYINSYIGTQLNAAQMATMLTKMLLQSRLDSDGVALQSATASTQRCVLRMH